LACFRVARVSQRLLGFLVESRIANARTKYSSISHFATQVPTYSFALTMEGL